MKTVILQITILLTVLLSSCSPSAQEETKKKPYKVNVTIRLEHTKIPEPYHRIELLHYNDSPIGEWKTFKKINDSTFQYRISVRNDSDLDYRCIIGPKSQKSPEYFSKKINTYLSDTTIILKNLEWDIPPISDWNRSEIYDYQNSVFSEHFQKLKPSSFQDYDATVETISNMETIWKNEVRKYGWKDVEHLNIGNLFFLTNRQDKDGVYQTLSTDEESHKLQIKYVLPQIEREAEWVMENPTEEKFHSYSGRGESCSILTRQLSHESWLSYRSVIPIQRKINKTYADANIALDNSLPGAEYYSFVMRNVQIYDALHAPDVQSMNSQLEEALDDKAFRRLLQDDQMQVNNMFREAVSRMNAIAIKAEYADKASLQEFYSKLFNAWASSTFPSVISTDSLRHIAQNVGIYETFEHRGIVPNIYSSFPQTKNTRFLDIRDLSLKDLNQKDKSNLLWFGTVNGLTPGIVETFTEAGRKSNFDTYFIITDPIRPGYTELDSLVTKSEKIPSTRPYLLDKLDNSLLHKYNVSAHQDVLWIHKDQVLLRRSEFIGRKGKLYWISSVENPLDSMIDEVKKKLQETND